MRPLAALLLCLALAACGRPEGRLGQICAELALPLLGTRPLPDPIAAPPAGTDVILRYERRPGGAGPGWVACGFAPATVAGELPTLERMVTSEEGELAARDVFLLNAYGAGWAHDMSPSPVAARPQPLTRSGYALQQVINALTPAGVYGLLAAAIALVYAQVGRLHLALGDLGMLGASSGWLLLGAAIGTPSAIVAMGLVIGAIAMALATSAAWAAASGAGLFGRLWRHGGSTPLIATVAAGLFLRELVRLLQGSRDSWLPPLLSRPVSLPVVPGIELSVGPPPLLSLTVTLATAAGLMLLLSRSRLGLCLRACADDPGMARLLGIDDGRVRLLAFALAGGCAALALTLVSIIYGTLGPEAGFVLGLKALTAAVVGGIGSVGGALLGGLLIGLLETFWAAYFGGAYREVAVFAVLVATLILRPQGLVPRPLLMPGERPRQL